MKTWTPKTTLIVAGVAVVGLWYVKSKAGEAVDAAKVGLNPVNSENWANRVAESWWDGGSDGVGVPGTDFFDWNQELNRKYYRYTPLGLYDRFTNWLSE